MRVQKWWLLWPYMTCLPLFGGVPEPGAVLHGSVTKSRPSAEFVPVHVEWIIRGGGDITAIAAAILNVNGQSYYIARIPFETRDVSGFNLEPSVNSLTLPAVPTVFTRRAMVDGVDATLVPPASNEFTMSKSDRGRVERVDLLVDLGAEPGVDTDGDGMSDWAEGIAGTDPHDALSVFRASTDIRPDANGPLVIQWSSVEGKTYTVSRAADLGYGFSVVASGLPSGGSTTSFTDILADGPGPFFYRILVDP